MQSTPSSPESVAYQSGQYTAQIVVVVVLLFFIVKSIQIARRPHANTKCALSLLFLLSGWLIVAGGVAVTRGNPTLLPVQLIASFVALAAIVTSIVLGIIGLIEYAQRRDLYSQGKTQAIVSLSLSGLFMVLTVGGAVAALSRTRAKLSPAAAQPRAGEELVFDELNFRFKAPARPWVRLDAKKINPYASLAFAKSARVYCIIIAEKENVGSLTTDSIVELMKANLQSAATRANVTDEFPETRNGLRGVRVNTVASVQALDFFYSQWAVATNGYVYQVHCWGAARHRNEVLGDANELLSGFSLMDLKRIPTRETNAAALFQSTHFPYRVDLRGSGWHDWPRFNHDVPQADFGAMHAKGGAMMVVPVWLPDDAHWDALVPALLETLDITYPSEQLTDRKELRGDGWEGVEYRFERTLDGNDFAYRLRTVKGTNFGALVAVWAAKQRTDYNATIEDGLARIGFLSDAAFKSDVNALPASQRHADSLVLNNIGLEYYKAKHYERSTAWFKAAAQLNPTNSTFPINVVHAYEALGRFQEALEFLHTHEGARSDPKVAAWEAYLQGQSGETSTAITNYARLFAGGYRADDHFAEYVRLLRDARTPEAALREVEKYAATRESIPVRLLQAELLGATRNFSNALTILTNLEHKAPFNAEVKYALAEGRLRAELFNEALQTARELVEQHRDSGYAYFLKGRSEYGLKWYREAKESLEIAARKSPASVEIKSYLEHVSGMLGEANNTYIKDPIAPVAIPPEVSRTAAVKDALYKDHGAYYVKQVSAISYLKNKEFKTTDLSIIKVLDSSGVSRFSTIQVPFNPFAEELFVNAARVKGTNGETISESKLSDYYVVDDTSTESVSQKKVLNIPLAALKPGCTIEVTVTRRDLGRPEQFRFVEHSFSSAVPVVQSVVYVTGDTAGLLSHTSAKAQPMRSGDGIWWAMDDPALYKWEPFQTSYSEFLPLLWLSDSNATWRSEVEEYLTAIRDRLQLATAERDVAGKLVNGLTNQSAKVAAIARHVQKDYSYRAIAFGRRARIPQKTEDFARSKNGDCKDHAVLLREMLVQAGVPAHLALVNTRGRVQTNMPSLDQFDHMIVFVPSLSNPFVDCTDKGTDLAQSIPLGLGGKVLLVLDDKAPHFVTVPRQDKTSILSRREVHITNQTDAVVSETLTMDGVAAAFLRSHLQRMQAEARQRLIEQFMNAPAATLRTVAFENIDEPSLPLVVRLRYDVRKQFEILNDQIVGRVPSCWERRYLAPEGVTRRTTPFEIYAPIRFESTVDLFVPDNFREPSLKTFDQSFNQTFASCKTSGEKRPRGARINFTVEQQRGQFSPVQYADFKDTMDRALGALEQSVVLSKN